MFLSSDSLQSLSQHVVGTSTPSIHGNSYVLHLGREVAKSSAPKKNEGSSLQKLNQGDSFVIDAGQLAYLLTEETIRVPHGYMGFISLDTQIKFRGLDDVSGFHVSPGYEGKLVFAVTNESPQDIAIRQGDGIFRLWLTKIDSDSPQTTASTTRISSISSEMLSQLENSRPTVLSLETRVLELEKLHSAMKWVLVTAVGAAVTAVITMSLTSATQPAKTDTTELSRSTKQPEPTSAGDSLPQPNPE